jgi:putative transposase
VCLSLSCAASTGCTDRQNIAQQCSRGGNASFYKWRSKYGGMDASMISQMKALEDENRRLKKMYAEMSMQAELLKEALGKK